jgi:DNA-binding IclR family transcriptional regulator
MPAAKETSVAVLVRAAAALNELAENGETTTAELSERLDEPRSSVYRLLRSLSSLGLAEEGEQPGGYRLGLTTLRLASVVLSQLEVRRVARPFMERLHDESEETVFLCVRRDKRAVFVDRIDGRRAANMAVAPGSSLPLHSGAGPRALLAFAPPADAEAYVAEAELTEFRTGTSVPTSVVLEELAATRETGVAVSNEDLTLGLAALGAPILDYRGEVRGAISVSGLCDDILGERRRFLTERLLAAAHETSLALGHGAHSAGNGR